MENITILWNKYKTVLPGLAKQDPEEFYYLAQVLEEEVFELLQLPEGYGVVYMMNDAIESFLVFGDARITGNYIEDKRDGVTGSLEHREDGYVLVIRQGANSVFTIHFSSLSFANHLYQYHAIGHFWMRKYEYLRQINYRLAILRDKYAFLGDAVCNPKEQWLLDLYDFAPLRRYLCISWEKGEHFTSTEEAISKYLLLAEEAKDRNMVQTLKWYQKSGGWFWEMLLYFQLRFTRHQKTVQLLNEKIAQASLEYPARKFDSAKEEQIAKAWKIISKKYADKKSITLLHQEPFTLGEEDTPYRIQVLHWKKGFVVTKVEIESFDLEQICQESDF